MEVSESNRFRSDWGYFFYEDGHLDIYSGRLGSGTVWDNVRQRHELLNDVEREVPHLQEPYYHEEFQFDGAQWKRTKREFTQAPKRYLDFGPCDAANQLELPDDPLIPIDSRVRRALPAKAKIKGAVVQDQAVALATSEASAGISSIYEPGTYRIRLYLLQEQKNTWQVVKSFDVEDWAYYCGMRTAVLPLESGRSTLMLLLYTSTPQGSRIVDVGRHIHTYLIQAEESAVTK